MPNLMPKIHKLSDSDLSMGIIQDGSYDSNTQLISSVPAWSNYSLVSSLSKIEMLALPIRRFELTF